LLSNLETNENKLLQMVLFGQPELDEKLRTPCIRQLKERITHSFYLDPFPSEDIYEYLNYRMRVVGYKGPDIFSKNISNRIEKKSEGLTRRINILADKALLAAYSEGDHGVKSKHINLAAKDSDFEQNYNWKYIASSAAAGFVIVFSVWIGTLIPGTQQQMVLSGETEVATQKATVEENTRSFKKVVEVVSAEPETVSKDINQADTITRQMALTNEWLNIAEGEAFTIQLVLLDAWAEYKVENFIKKSAENLDLDKVYVYQATIRGRKVYSILYNEYPDRQAAVQQLKKLPESLTRNGPYLRTVKGIRADIRKSQSLANAN